MILTKVDKADYQGKEYRVITLSDGSTFNVKSGQNGILRAKWGLLEQGIGQEITLTMGEYKGKPFVADFVIGAATTIAPQAPVVPATPPKPIVPSQTTNDSIKQQVAIKEIGENLRKGVPQPPTYIIRYWHLVGESLGIPVQTPTLGDPTPNIKPPVVEELFRTEEPPKFLDGAELAKWYTKKGGTLARFKTLTSNPNPNDIKDVNVAAKMVIKEDGSIVK